MWWRKKLVIVAVLATVVLAGSIGGAVLAADNDEDGNPEAVLGTLLDKVFAIYEEKTGVAIDRDALRDAFDQARSERQTEALKTWLQSLVEEGKITQEQADEYLQWQQARPDVPFGPNLKGRGMFRGHFRFPVMGGCRGWDGIGSTTE